MYRLSYRILIPAGIAVILLAVFLAARNAHPSSRPSRRLSAAASRHDAWRILGPGGGGAQFYHAISPLDPGLMLLSCDMSGNYISRDGGSTWRMFNLEGQARGFVFDPSDARVVYALAGGVYRSENGGDTWQLLYPAPSAVTRVFYADDEGETRLMTAAGPVRTVTAMAIDPAERSVLYLAQDNLTVSTDFGKTWKALGGDFDGLVRKVFVDPYSPLNDRSVYVITSHRLFLYEHGGWQTRSPLPDSIQEAAVSFSPAGPVLSILTGPKISSELLVSRDRGATWISALGAMREGLADRQILPRLRALVTVDGEPNELFVSYGGLRLKSAPNADYFGVAHTRNAGASWEYLWQSASEQPANVHDEWMSERFGTYWAENPLAMAIRKNLILAGDLGRTLRSTDRGRTWNAVYARRIENAYITTGIDVTTSYGVHFDPFDPNRLFVSYTDIGLFRSETGGDTWMPSTDGVDRAWRNTTYWMEFDPTVSGRAWAVMSNTHDLPRTRVIRRGTANLKGGVMTSSDGGRSWRKSNRGMMEAACTHIILDPASPPDNRTLYVAALGRGVYRSLDGGRNWELKSAGLPGPEPLVWRLALQGNTLYAVVVRRKDNGTFGSADDGGIYRSYDRGDTWRRVNLPEGVNGPTGIAIARRDARRLYLSAWARTDTRSAQNRDGGVFVSSDEGETWSYTLQDPRIYDVTVDARNPDRVYAAGFASSAWRSDDQGQTWHRLRGFNFKTGHRVIPDPRDNHNVFITTFGGSIWHGPADGDPEAVEDLPKRAAPHSAK